MKKTTIITALLFLSMQGFSQTKMSGYEAKGKPISISYTELPESFFWTIDGESFKVSKDTASHPGIELVTERTSFLMCMELAKHHCLEYWLCNIQCFAWLNPFCVAAAAATCIKNPNTYNIDD